MTQQPGDADPSRPKDTAVDDMSTRLSRISTSQGRASVSDLNVQPPTVQYDNQGHRFFDSAPTPLKRLFGSPLVQSGKFARGPNRERVIGDGWGAARNFSYDPHINTNSRHMGLDFFAPKGETLFACGDGTVTFVGYQSKNGAESVEGATQGPNGTILNAKGETIATQDQVGFGGIAVHIKHTGDFQNYRTEYYHMSAITAKTGQKVTEGSPIGAVGNSGVAGIGPHLHFQIAYFAGKTSALVNPTGLVPNYRPGKADSTNTAGAFGVILPLLAPNGTQIMAGQAANVINNVDRSTSLANQDGSAIKQGQSDYADRARQIVNVQQSALYASSASFAATSPTVTAPMTFDFTTGTWSDGGVT
jgi:murein DD-endopeptidase MepM/ murein hydrolase activator NlpD